jgi:ferrous iron transport protein A
MSHTLADLAPGRWASIDSLATGRPTLTRLRELGMVPGTAVQVIRRAPLGEPVEISLRGSRLAIRNHEAAHISVREL